MEYTLWEHLNKRFTRITFGLNPYSNGIYSMSVWKHLWSKWRYAVLILILMEYTLWVYENIHPRLQAVGVLILILMEYTLWAEWLVSYPVSCYASLNPYSNGIYSMRSLAAQTRRKAFGLNPYSNGIYSMSNQESSINQKRKASLNPYSNGICSMRFYTDTVDGNAVKS